MESHIEPAMVLDDDEVAVTHVIARLRQVGPRVNADRSVGDIWESRPAKRAAAAMEALDRTASGRDNLMPFIIEAVRAAVTLGEVSDVLRRRFDEYRPQMAV